MVNPTEIQTSTLMCEADDPFGAALTLLIKDSHDAPVEVPS